MAARTSRRALAHVIRVRARVSSTIPYLEASVGPRHQRVVERAAHGDHEGEHAALERAVRVRVRARVRVRLG